jgi:hypothetical protein
VTEPRLLSGAGAATYCGVTPATWSKWVADGRAPKPLPGTRRWDRKAIDLALDKISGIPAAPSTVSFEDEYAEWKREYDARKAALERDPEYIRKEAEQAARSAKRRGGRQPI